MNKPLPAFTAYQLAFAAHLRDPACHPAPKGVRKHRMQVYAEIVFNNLLSAVSGCFPVAQTMLGKRAWKQLVKRFFAEHQANTPIFREIPEQFLHFLQHCDNLPAYLYPLAHYEWAELAVAHLPQGSANPITQVDDLLSYPVVVNPALMSLQYPFAVHRMGSPRRKIVAETTYLLVYRNPDFVVEFIEINAMTAHLLTLLQIENQTGEAAIRALAAQIQHPQPETMLAFGQQLLKDWLGKGVLLGIKPDFLLSDFQST